jgi:hypothetical protein
MLGYLQGIFDWFVNVGGVFFEGIFNVVRRFKWFFVAVLASVLAPIKWVLELAKGLTGGMVDASAQVVALVSQLQIEQSAGLWGSLAQGAALMNCVVPLDVVLSSFGVLLSLWLVIFGIKAALFVYRHLPTIHGWGSNG